MMTTTSLVHKDSAACAIEQLELFRARPTCSQIVQSITVPHYNISSLEGGTNVLEFIIQGSGDQYVDLTRTKLGIKFRVRQDSRDLPATANVAPLVNFLGSMFQQCDIFLNNKLITSSNNLYAHRAYLEQLLTYSRETADRQLSSQLFYLDTPGHLDAVNDDQQSNEGFQARKAHVAGSRLVEVRGPLFNDLSNQSAYVLNNVDIRIRLTRSENKFCLMATNADEVKAVAADAGGQGAVAARAASNFNVHIEQATLHVQKVTLHPQNQIAVETLLRKQNAIYNMQRTEMKSFTIAEGDRSFTREHINLGLSPKYAIVGLVSTEAMQGLYGRNPFNFQHFNLKHISLNVDGEQVPRGGINCNYEEDLYLDAYESLVDVAGKWRSDNPLMINRDSFKKGFALYGFQIAPELVEGAFNLIRNTNIRLDLQFANPLTENVTVLVWFAYDGVLEIDRQREVFYDFSG
jgi:hypothetical protein